MGSSPASLLGIFPLSGLQLECESIVYTRNYRQFPIVEGGGWGVATGMGGHPDGLLIRGNILMPYRGV